MEMNQYDANNLSKVQLRTLMQYLCDRADSFSFCIPDLTGSDKEYAASFRQIEWMLEEIQPLLIQTGHCRQGLYSSDDNLPQVFWYRMSNIAKKHILEIGSPNRWQLRKGFPEDLALYQCGRCLMQSIAHEGYLWCYLEEHDAAELERKGVRFSYLERNCKVPVLKIEAVLGKGEETKWKK